MSGGKLPEPKGKVFLVGAGPGAPGLLTLRGKAVLSEAEVVIYDALANKSLLRYAPENCEYINAGKRSGLHRLKQHEINALIVEKARENKRVVRLKGGDPFLFGRGGEEAEALEAAGIPYEVIPGVSSAYAVPAYAGIPLTRRGSASAVHIFTAHGAVNSETEARDWTEAAKLGGTLVFLMGFSRIPDITAALMQGGLGAATAVAVVQWGTTIHQRQVFSTLGSAAEDVTKAGLGSPAVFIVGDTAEEASRLRWTETLPFFGRSIAFTRDARRAIPWLEAFEGLGARVFDFPMVHTTPVTPSTQSSAILAALRKYDWVVFTNSLSVEIFFDLLKSEGFDARSLAACKVAAIGPTTAESLLNCGIRADLVPAKMSQEGLAEELPIRPGMRVLLPGSPRMRETLQRVLEQQGAEVTRLPLYDSQLVASARDELIKSLETGELDALVLVAPQAVQMLAEMRSDLDALLKKVKVVCLGSQAATVLGEHGRKADAVLERPVLDELVEVLKKCMAHSA